MTPAPDAPAPKTPAAPRQGLKLVGGHYPLPAANQFKLLSVEKGRTMEDMLAEAMNDLFAKYGKPEVFPVKGKPGAA